MKKRGRIRNVVFIIMFFMGLFMLFGAAGYSDWAVEEGVDVSLSYIAIRMVLGVGLMLPFCVWCSIGGYADGNNGNS